MLFFFLIFGVVISEKREKKETSSVLSTTAEMALVPTTSPTETPTPTLVQTPTPKAESKGLEAQKQPTATPVSVPTLEPTNTPIPQPTNTPIPTTPPSNTPTPTVKPTSTPEPIPTPYPTPSPLTRIEGLAYIRVSSVWINWDADAEDDGAKVEIVYYDTNREIVSTRDTAEVSLTVDSNVYTRVWDYEKHERVKDRLVFSKTYQSDEIIRNSIYPWFKVPKEQLSVNPEIDYKYGVIAITIHTPEQGDFSAEDDVFTLYE